jgi:prepilin-type processing-associated H-X9-DG protein
MRTITYRISAALWVLALSAPALAEAPLADKVPAEAVIYVGWAGKTAALDGSLLGELLNDPAVGNLLGMAKTALLGHAPPDARGIVEHAWAMADITWRQPAAGVLLDLTLEPKRPDAKAFLLIDLGKDRDAFAAHVDAVIQWAVENKHLTSQAVTAGPVAYTRLRLEDKKIPPLAIGYIGPMFFFAVGEGVPEAIAAVTPEKSLRANKDFQAAHKFVEHENEQLTYSADLAGLWGRIKKMAQNQEPRAASATATQPRTHKVDAIQEALGLAKGSRIVWSVSVVRRNLLMQGRLVSPAPHRGLLMLLAGAPLADDALAHVPADAHLAAAINLSPADFYAEIRRIVRSFSPEAEAQMLEGEAKVGKSLGLSVTEDLLPAFGDTWVLASAPSWGGAFTGTLLTVKVKDAAKAANVLEKIEAFLARSLPGDRPRTEAEVEDDAAPPRRGGPAIQTRQVGPATIKYVAFRGQLVPVAPAWAIHEGRLYVGLWPQVVEAAVAGKCASPLPASPAYAALKERIGKGAGALVYLDGGAVARDLYNFLLVGWTMGSGELAKHLPAVRQDWLPALATLQKYLPPEMAAVTADANGITFRNESSLGGVATGGIALPAAAAIAIPAAANAIESARRVGSSSNLHQIGMACMQYQADKGRLPPDLETLVTGSLIQPETLSSPIAGSGNRARLVDGKVVGRIDYVYISGLDIKRMEDPVGCVLAYERPENYENRGTNVLFVDGSVQWMAMKDFQEALAKTRERNKKEAPAASQPKEPAPPRPGDSSE